MIVGAWEVTSLPAYYVDCSYPLLEPEWEPFAIAEGRMWFKRPLRTAADEKETGR